MKKILYKIALMLTALVLGVGMNSCTDWLLIYPEGETLLEDYWKTGADIEKVVASCYRSMQEEDFIARTFVWGELRSDNLVAGKEATDEQKSLLDVNILATNTWSKWSAFYVPINYANTVLHYAPGVMEEDKNLTLSQMNAYRAEALAVRAFCYFYLVRAFRDVPFVRQATIDDTAEFDMAKTPGHLILDTLIMDLQEAKRYARVSYGANTAHNKGRFTQQSIRALLADIYLWAASGIGTDSLPEAKAREYWEGCVRECREFQAYENSLDILAQSYLADMDFFLSDVFIGGNSSESIFELQYSYSAGLANKAIPALYGSSKKRGQVAVSEVLNPLNYTSLFKSTDMRKYYFVQPSQEGFRDVAKYICGSVDALGDDNYTFGYSYYEYNNVVFYRLPDIYLMEAEALVELSSGSTDPRMTDAIVLLNKTYKRANPKMNRNDTLSLISYNSVQEMRRLVLDERQREFMFEGKRWFDLLRMARRLNDTEIVTDAVMPKYTDFADLSLALSKMSNMDALYMPINAEEIKNNQLLEQNPFYSIGSEVTTSK